MTKQNTPGIVWKSHGAWHWKIKFPDEKRRRGGAFGGGGFCGGLLARDCV